MAPHRAACTAGGEPQGGGTRLEAQEKTRGGTAKSASLNPGSDAVAPANSTNVMI